MLIHPVGFVRVYFVNNLILYKIFRNMNIDINAELNIKAAVSEDWIHASRTDH